MPNACFTRRQSLLALAALTACPLHAADSGAPIRFVVPFPAGGAADLMARGLAQRLATELGQQVVVDNRGGAGGTLAAEAVAKAAPDGLTLFFATMGTHAINASLYPKLRYDPVRDFAPVSLTHLTPRVLVVGPSVKARDVRELIALAKSRPGGLTYGSAGNGSSSHLSGALFAAQADVELLHVPYKGSAPLLTEVLAGRVDMTFDSYAVYEEHLKAGKVRALAVTARQRMAVLPQVPTVAESGLAGYEVSNWLGVVAPAATPPDTGRRLQAAVAKAMADKAHQQQLRQLGIEPVSDSPEAFAALIRTEVPKWAEVVKRAGATVDN